MFLKILVKRLDKFAFSKLTVHQNNRVVLLRLEIFFPQRNFSRKGYLRFFSYDKVLILTYMYFPKCSPIVFQVATRTMFEQAAENVATVSVLKSNIVSTVLVFSVFCFLGAG